MLQPLRILFIAESSSEFLSVKQHLEARGLAQDLHQVGGQAELKKAVAVGQWDVVLAACSLNGSCFEATRTLLGTLLNEVPVLLLTSRREEDQAAQELDRGAWDYVCQDDLTRLWPAIKRARCEAEFRRSCRLAESARQVSEQQKAVVLNSVTSHIAVLNSNGRIIATNAAWRRFGVENSNCPGTLPPDCDIDADYLSVCRQSHGSSAEGARAAHDGIEAVLEGRLDRFELEYPCHSATEQRWFLMTATPLHPADGAVIAHVNITERKLSELELAKREARYRALFDAIPESMFLMSLDADILAANAGFAARFNKSVDQCAGQNLLRLVPPHLVETRRLWMAEVVRTRRPVVNEEAWGQRWLRHHFCPVFGAEGQVERMVVLAVDITERKHAEEQLRKSEQRFRSLIESSPIAMGFVDHDGAITLLNRRFTELFGYRVDEIQKLEDWWRLAYPDGDYRKQVMATWDRATVGRPRAARTGSPREWLVTCKNKEVLTVQVSSIVLPEGVLTSFVDLTAHKRAEARAARDKGRSEFLLDLHQRAEQLTDSELYSHVLDQAMQLTGSTIGCFHLVAEDQQKILSTTWNQATPEAGIVSHETPYPAAEMGIWMDCLREQRPVILNHYERPPSPREFPEGLAAAKSVMAIPVIRESKVRIIIGVGNKANPYDEDDVAQLQVVANDLHMIMLQRAAQNQLHRSEQRFRHLVETTYDWIWEVDASSRYTYASPKVLDLLGYTPEEVLGRTPFDLMPPEEAQRVAVVFGDIASKRESFSGLENTNLHKDGREVVLETSGMPVLGEQGELLGYRGMDRDITERKRLESQLRQAQKLEAIGQLAGGVAHDFNNILAAIEMQLSLLEMKADLDDETRLGLADVHEGANRAANLTRQLLMFSRRSVLAVKAIDLGEVIENLLKMLHRLIGEDIRLSFARKKPLPRVEADAGMLEQVIMNLVVNARDAMPRGGAIDITTSVIKFAAGEHVFVPERREGTFLCLTVKDTGCGMDAPTLKRIFEPFFTTKEPGKGTGLGLATVHGIVAQHKGWVEVESHVGKGTRFRVFLPVLPEAVTPESSETSRASVERGREGILVVEDETNLRRSVVKALRVLGYRVYEAENGQKAMVLWRMHGAELDLLLTDMVMPEGMTGLELAQQLLEMKPTLKVIVSSGYSSEVVQAGGIKRAGIHYLPKPYAIETLSETIRVCLAGEK